MVRKDKLIKLLEEYEINGEKVIRNNSNILSRVENKERENEKRKWGDNLIWI